MGGLRLGSGFKVLVAGGVSYGCCNWILMATRELLEPGTVLKGLTIRTLTWSKFNLSGLAGDGCAKFVLTSQFQCNTLSHATAGLELTKVAWSRS
jgi:hypothetical protein